GFPNSVDACDYSAEDFDGFEDTDGCPEPGPFGTKWVCDDYSTGAYLYTIEGFGGDCLRVDENISDLNQTLNGHNFNDRTKSIKLVGVSYVRVCRDANNGNCMQFTQSDTNLADNSMESAISSVYLTPDGPPPVPDDYG